jgi:ribosome-binding protein aMBF1 (putative translation factor)
VSEPQEDTPQTEPAPDEEAQIAEQMAPDADETPDDVTGPGPESPFQPPELHPDDEPAPEDEPKPDEPDDEPDEQVSDYAPGVAEARLLSEREAEALGKKIDAERKRHGKRVMELLGDDLGGHIPCPTCMDGIDGFIISPEYAPLGPDQRERMLEILGLDDWESMPSASWAAKCETCDGFGKIKTGSKVQGREVTGCEDCAETGWRNLRMPAQVNGSTDTVPSAVTGPTVAQDLEPDPRVKALREEGYMVIPRVPVASGE